MTLAVLTDKLKQITNRSTDQLRDTLRIFQPETVLKWHRELVRRKWTTEHKNKEGGMHVIPTPLKAPNAYAQRWVRTVREECLDHLLM